MVSRRKILSRSRDDLNVDQSFVVQQLEEDVWYQKDKLFKEHIQEVLDKWEQIDDEIWAKVIVFERNRRVAKAYARTPVLTVNGADDGFDGMRIGLNGFENPLRDAKTADLKRQIGQGIKLKMDDAGNILVRRYARSNVYVKSTGSAAAAVGAKAEAENSISADILKLPGQALEADKVLRLFDMKKFQSNINRELRQAYPDRRRLELQCLSAVSFVRSEPDILDCPVWVLIVNVVAMDLLKSKLPPIAIQRASNVKSRPRLPIPDEDPYSVAGQARIQLIEASDSSGYGGSNNTQLQQQQHLQQQQQHIGDISAGISGHHHTASTTAAQMREQLYQMGPAKSAAIGATSAAADAQTPKPPPPQLPPRDSHYFAQQDLPTPDYDEEVKVKPFFRGNSKTDKNRKKYVTEDPYYCGLSARVPKFDAAKTATTKPTKKQSVVAVPKRMSVAYLQPVNYNYQLYASQQQLMMPPSGRPSYHHQQQHQHQQQQQQHQQQQMMWHARSMESGLDYSAEFSASQHYGFDRQQPLMHRAANRRPV